MMRSIVTALLLCLCGCSKMRNVDGELFLAGKDKHRVNFTGIDVAAYDVEACAATFMAMSDDLSKQGNYANKLYGKVTELADVLSSRAKKAEDAMRRATGAAQEKAAAIHREAAERERRGIELRDVAELLVRLQGSAAPFFENLPKALGPSVQTDAAGRFSIAVPKSRQIALVAVAESSATGELETHYWIVKVAEWETHATLSSDNTTAASKNGSSGKGDTLLQTSPLKASATGIKIADLRASIERKLEDLSRVSADLSTN